MSVFSSESLAQTSLVRMYVKCDRIKDALKLFDVLPLKHVVIFRALLGLILEKTA